MPYFPLSYFPKSYFPVSYFPRGDGEAGPEPEPPAYVYLTPGRVQPSLTPGRVAPELTGRREP